MAPTKYHMVPVYSLKLVKERSVKYPVDHLSDSNAVTTVMQEYLGAKDCEHLAVIMLDNANNMLGIATVSTGTIGATHQSVRDMFKHAIAGRASAIIIGHNHPSNNCTPSSEDILFTRQVVAASKILGIPILDHVIVSSGITKSSYSFAYHGIIGGRDD